MLGDRRDRIDRTAATYLWEQVLEDLRDLMASGDLEPGERLPAEQALADAYGVSRITMRRVVSELAKSGWLIVRHGRGVFVAPESSRLT
jgi:DNA-binding GntR family transcriptional regulator